MIVYSSREQPAATATLLKSLQAQIEPLIDAAFPARAQALDLLIEFGQLEAALSDALLPESDESCEITCDLRTISLALGHLFYRSWRDTAPQTPLAPAPALLERLQALPLPETLALRVAEGYAYYALYPETYLLATEQFICQTRPERVVCIGIRSIGTSLSAVVGAALEALGCQVRAYTVRPRGHPFERRLVLGPNLKAEWCAWKDAYFLIIDEGPGLSGSSFGGTAQALSELGIPDRQIVFFPSWSPDGSQFISALARDHWQRHRKFAVSFEQVWIESGRLADSIKASALQDLSAGAWRALYYADEKEYPAVQPQHERRKYLCQTAAGEPSKVLLKFSGLGHYGRAALERAEHLADSGFGPPALGLCEGFLMMAFVSGVPLTCQAVTTPLLDTIARYLAFLRTTYATGCPADYEAMTAMITVNAAEGLGEQWAAKLACLERYRTAVCQETTVALDGRMLPYEWLQTPAGYLKTDGVDHHNDHFFPGCQDIAWDIAGCAVEFKLSAQALDYLVERYKGLTGDSTLAARLPFYRIAYSAYRLGYASLAVDALGSSAESGRFKRLVGCYTTVLQQAIAAG